MLYECPRCHYSSNNKCHYIKHLQKQKECLPTFSDKPSDKILEEFIEEKHSSKKYKCDNCDKSFAFSSGLSRHVKEVHTTITINNDSHNHIDNSHSHNTTNTNSHNTHNTTNTTNTNSHNTTNTTISPIININIYGRENLEYINNNPDFMLNCLKNIDTHGIPDLIEKVHLNDDYPENKNIKHKREHYPSKMMIYTEKDGVEQWVETDGSIVLDELVKNGTNLIIKLNSQVLTFSATSTTDELDRYEMRKDKIYAIKEKKRGKYASVRNEVATRIKNKTKTDNLR
jgi:hypothetical protein